MANPRWKYKLVDGIATDGQFVKSDYVLQENEYELLTDKPPTLDSLSDPAKVAERDAIKDPSIAGLVAILVEKGLLTPQDVEKAKAHGRP